MRTDDLPYVVSEHQASLPDGLYARLGARFLHAYHSAYLTSPGAAALLGELEGRPAGFVTGVVSAVSHRWAMRQAWRKLATVGAIALLQRPLLASRMLSSRSAASYLSSSVRLLRHAPAADTTIVKTGVLAYLAVDVAARGHGVGDALLDAFIHQARGAGCLKVTLATRAGAQGAEQFYADRGWTREALHHTPEGSPLQVMAWTWPPTGTTDDAACHPAAVPRAAAPTAPQTGQPRTLTSPRGHRRRT